MLPELEFSLQIFEKYSKTNLIKIRPLGAELFQVDGRTDMTKLIVAYGNFANARKNRQRKRSRLIGGKLSH